MPRRFTNSDTDRQSGYSLLISSSDEDPVLELQEIEALIARRIDALVLASSERARSNNITRCLKEARVPHMLLDRPLRGLNSHFVGSDDQAIGRLATEHLIERGYRRIAHKPSLLASSEARVSGSPHA